MSEFYYHCDEKLYPMDNMKILIASSPPPPPKRTQHRHTHLLDILMTSSGFCSGVVLETRPISTILNTDTYSPSSGTHYFLCSTVKFFLQHLSWSNVSNLLIYYVHFLFLYSSTRIQSPWEQEYLSSMMYHKLLELGSEEVGIQLISKWLRVLSHSVMSDSLWPHGL